MLQCSGLNSDIVNNVNGNNLIECDQVVLKEMGIKKIGDRVRIFVAIKQLRTRAVGNYKKRTRDSIAALDNRHFSTSYTPSSGSPRQINPTRPSDNRRHSRLMDSSVLENYHAGISHLRSNSPLAELDGRGLRADRYGNMSPIESARKDPQGSGYLSHPSSANTISGRRPWTPSRQTHNLDTSGGKLSAASPHIRVIYNSGQTKVLDIKNCNSADQIMLNVLRKLGLNEHHTKNYCFYVLEGTDVDRNRCYRLSDADLVRLCRDTSRNDRGRLILRKIHAGEPDDEDLRKAASIAFEEYSESHAAALAINHKSSRVKLEKITGESLETFSSPLSPAPFQLPRGPPERQRSGSSATQDWDPPKRSDSFRSPKPRIKEFLGGRPPSELISQELTTYFPDHQKETIERAVRMSMRRSARLSRAASRISVASNISFASSLKDAPPLPNIADLVRSRCLGLLYHNQHIAILSPRPRYNLCKRSLRRSRIESPMSLSIVIRNRPMRAPQRVMAPQPCTVILKNQEAAAPPLKPVAP
jgi:mitogen-activated protein kinase kinase kinase